MSNLVTVDTNPNLILYKITLPFKPRLPPFLLSMALWLCFATYAGAEDSARDRILATFRAYEALNVDFVSSVGHSKGVRGKPYAALRKEVEAYAEGPFSIALGEAKTQACRFRDIEVIRALFRVTLATSNSADESPAWTLGYIFVCQPDLVAKSFGALPLSKRQALYSTLEFGFENVVFDEPTEDTRVLELRRKLQALEPRWKQ